MLKQISDLYLLSEKDLFVSALCTYATGVKHKFSLARRSHEWK